MKRLRKYFALIEAVRVSDPKTRVAIIRAAPDDFIKTLIEVILNFLRGNITLHQNKLGKLRKRKLQLRRLADYRGKSGIKKARKELIQRGGILPFLLPIIAAAGGLAAAAPAIARKVSENATNSALDTVEKRANDFIKKL